VVNSAVHICGSCTNNKGMSVKLYYMYAVMNPRLEQYERSAIPKCK